MEAGLLIFSRYLFPFYPIHCKYFVTRAHERPFYGLDQGDSLSILST